MIDLFKKTKQILALTVVAMIVFSCSKETEEALEQEQNEEVTQAELKTILETDDISSVADNVVADLFNAEKSGKSAKTDDCYEAVYTETGFTVTFSDCSIEESDDVNGTLTIVYGKENDNYAFVVTYDNLMVGTMKVNGTRSFAMGSGEKQNSVEFNITSDMSITFADGSIISEEGSKTFAIVFGEEFGDGMLTIDGEWTVKADGNTYSVNVTDLLEANFGCEYVGKGLMDLNKNGLEVSVDFGDGNCDDIAAVIYPDGTEKNFSLKD
ncbi:MAG: hypothetical protein HKN31_06525 [Pricia sp.]|nr:hypothetical protein [Pricia sp.]